MSDDFEAVARIVYQTCAQYPGGIRAVVRALLAEDGTGRSESTLYADLNPNPTAQGKLKVRDFMRILRITGDVSALRYMAALCGYALTALDSPEPDAPTVEGEMLQDYPALVAFHEAVRRGDGAEVILARMDAALADLRQTAAMAIRRDRGEEPCER